MPPDMLEELVLLELSRQQRETLVRIGRYWRKTKPTTESSNG